MYYSPWLGEILPMDYSTESSFLSDLIGVYLIQLPSCVPVPYLGSGPTDLPENYDEDHTGQTRGVLQLSSQVYTQA